MCMYVCMCVCVCARVSPGLGVPVHPLLHGLCVRFVVQLIEHLEGKGGVSEWVRGEVSECERARSCV